MSQRPPNSTHRSGGRTSDTSHPPSATVTPDRGLEPSDHQKKLDQARDDLYALRAGQSTVPRPSSSFLFRAGSSRAPPAGTMLGRDFGGSVAPDIGTTNLSRDASCSVFHRGSVAPDLRTNLFRDNSSVAPGINSTGLFRDNRNTSVFPAQTTLGRDAEDEEDFVPFTVSQIPRSFAPSSLAVGNVKSLFRSKLDLEMAKKQESFDDLSAKEQEKQQKWVERILANVSACADGRKFYREEGSGYFACEGGGHRFTDALITEGKGGVLAINKRLVGAGCKRSTAENHNFLTETDNWKFFEGPYYPLGEGRYQFSPEGQKADTKDVDEAIAKLVDMGFHKYEGR